MADDDKQDADEKVVVGRGPSYPFIDLRKAVSRVEEITAKGAERTKMAPESFYKFWGYKPKSSGARQTMAAMNAYGLVEYVGRGKDRRIVLSDCARRIALDRRPNSSERLQAVQQAALEPSIFAELWSHFGPHLPDEEVMTSWLVLDREFNQNGADAAVDNFIATVEFANLDKPANLPEKNDSQVDEGVVESEPASVGDLVECEINGQVVHEAPVRVRAITDDGEWVFVEGSETGIAMSDVTVIERDQGVAESSKAPPRMPFVERAKADVRENDIKPLFDFDSVTIDTKITNQWHLGELIARLQQIKPMLPERLKPDESD